MIRRKSVTILVGDGDEALTVEVREVTPGLCELFHKAMLGGISAGAQLDNAAALADMLVGDTATRLELLEACTSLGAQVHELGAAAFLQLWQALEEVNAPFFGLLLERMRQASRLMNTARSTQPRPGDTNSAGQSASSSHADTPEPTTTA